MFAVHQKDFSIHDVSFPLLTWSVDNLTVSESREEETMMLFNKKHTVIMDYIITIQSYALINIVFSWEMNLHNFHFA